jgi:hypothetical protein
MPNFVFLKTSGLSQPEPNQYAMKFRTSLLMLLFAGLGTGVQAQDAKAIDTLRSSKGWYNSAAASFNVSQTSLTNWAAGGDNAISGIVSVNLLSDYKKNGHSWVSSFNGAYGLIKSGDNPFRKSDDRLELNSKYGYETVNKWFLTILMNAWTQFADGFQYQDNVKIEPAISRFMAPGYLQIGPGMDYIPNEDFSIFISPATAKFTFVTDQAIADLGTFGNTPALLDTAGNPIAGTGEQIRTEFGANLRANYRKQLTDEILFNTSLGLFSNYLDNPQRIDVNWAAGITANVWKVLAISINTELIYDYDILLTDFDNPLPEGGFGTKRGVQFRQILGVGIAYTINNAKK